MVTASELYVVQVSLLYRIMSISLVMMLAAESYCKVLYPL